VCCAAFFVAGKMPPQSLVLERVTLHVFGNSFEQFCVCSQESLSGVIGSGFMAGMAPFMSTDMSCS
jgi:hypothetical protein